MKAETAPSRGAPPGAAVGATTRRAGPLAGLGALLRRDLRVALRRQADTAAALVFFLIVVSLFPLGIGPEPALLRRLAPGAIWVAALLATLLSLPRLFADDHLDGTLEQVLLAATPLPLLVLAKVVAHWLGTGLPLTLLSPLLALQFDLDGRAIGVLAASLLLGTPLLSLIGAIMSALTLGVRGGGVLLALLVLPLYIPVLVFGAGAVEASSAGLGISAHFSLLGAMLVLALFLAPWAAAWALRIAIE
ncbi:MAG TPA: heme exporter protein CcmB [Ottowia sp.]|uniref:heme exporter protein CcmB n=1 Tax=Ottowia sp. TaxID=1898956 RepID=UPI002C45F7F0|nr:heme exporter protein CcmB [Ottowia sp.]HMN22085.1 heme exporter protein CcmB [Ottowia sp.]